MSTLTFITRDDLPRGRQAAQLIHVMDEWAKRFGYHGGTVKVLSVPTLKDLQFISRALDPATTASFREPDLDDKLTAVVTKDDLPELLDLPLLR